MAKGLGSLKKISSEIKTLEKISSLLDWDMQTYMPAKGGGFRSDQQALLQTIIHDKLCSPFLRKELESHLKDGAVHSLGRKNRALLRELKRRHVWADRIPRSLVEEMARTDAIAFQKWTEARSRSDFSLFAPYLEKQVVLNRKVARFIGYKGSPYDVLLDHFEPGATAAWIAELFEYLKKELIAMVRRIRRAPDPPSHRLCRGSFPLDRQWAFGLKVLARMGFDSEAGRQDKSVHPFTASCGGTGDVRLTTRFSPSDLRPGLFGTLHEGGHALYEQGFHPSIDGTLLGGGISCAVHESQSRLWENMVGRSRPFWKYWFPKLRKVFPGSFDGITVRAFYRAINRVQPSLIRVEADEVTYGLHIILRFEIEKDLIEGVLKTRELPRVWNEKMRDYLGIVPQDAAKGLLQDVHWSCGYFGYFPSYTLGNLYAAQFYAAAEKDLPNLDESIGRGDFKPLRGWLRENIHCHGKTFTAGELVQRISSKPLDVEDFMRYLNRKFHDIYSPKNL